MFSESRKMHLLEEVIKLKDESVLMQLEALVSKSSQHNEPRHSAKELVGMFSAEDAALMDKAINEGCEQIDPADWQ